MRSVSLPVQVLLALATTVANFSAASSEIYRRAELTEIRTGIVDVRVVYGPRLDIPVNCDEGFFACREELSFTRLYAMDLALETRSVMEGTSRIDRENRGSVFLALNFDAEDEELFDDKLRAHLSSLGADVFMEDYAQLEISEPITMIPARSMTRSLACFRSDDSGKMMSFSRTLGIDDDTGKEYVKTNHTHEWYLNEQWESLCDAMAEATRDVYPDEIRTLPIPRKVEESRIHFVGRNSIRDVAYVEELTPLPQGSSFTRARIAEDDSLGTSTRAAGDGSSAQASWAVQDERWTYAAEQADISPNAVQNNAWLTRWELESVERSFGPDPVDQVLSVSSFTIAFLATPPPVQVDRDNMPLLDDTIEEISVRLDEAAFLAELGKRLDQQKELNVGTLEKVLKDMPAGLDSAGWILVICRPDGSAAFGIPSAATSTALVRLTNADMFCAAVDAQLE
jgi:hypothetical protein